MKLGVARVTHEGDGKAQLATTGGEVEKLLLGVDVDADLGDARVKPVGERGRVVLVVLDPGPSVGGAQVGPSRTSAIRTASTQAWPACAAILPLRILRSRLMTIICLAR